LPAAKLKRWAKHVEASRGWFSDAGSIPAASTIMRCEIDEPREETAADVPSLGLLKKPVERRGCQNAEARVLDHDRIGALFRVLV